MLSQPKPLNDGYTLPGPETIAFSVSNIGSASEIPQRLGQVLKAGVRHLVIPCNAGHLSQLSNVLASSNIPRDQLFITFCWHSAPGMTDAGKVLKRALDQLRLQYADMYLLRPADAGNKDTNATMWAQMEKLKIQGQLVRSIGLLNFSLNQILTLLPTATIIPAVNQLVLTPYSTQRLKRTIKACERLGIAVTASLSDTVFLSLGQVYTVGGLDKILSRIAQQHSATPSRILVAWLQAKGFAPVVTWKEAERFNDKSSQSKDFQLVPLELTAVEVALIDIAGEGAEHAQSQTHGGAQLARAVGTAVGVVGSSLLDS
ncbi:NADP-dependent oxidoreductase domain-containing protein [Mycena amicta]|nr:NADP-dependent oxidoreductase domain-containing protein [Mycena amicta]